MQWPSRHFLPAAHGLLLTQIGTADFCHPATNILRAYLLAESLFENCLDYHP